jgi:hypothetical protein
MAVSMRFWFLGSKSKWLVTATHKFVTISSAHLREANRSQAVALARMQGDFMGCRIKQAGQGCTRPPASKRNYLSCICLRQSLGKR